MMDNIVKVCQNLLKDYPGAETVREYINARISPETQNLFQFGYFPNTEELYLLSDFVGKDLLIKYKLLYLRTIEDSMSPRIVPYSHFDNYPLIIPFHDCYGKIVGLVGRTLLPESEMKSKKISKYKNTADFKKGNHLFGLWHNKQDIIEKNCVYIVEGQIDVMKAIERGIKNIVAMGNNNMSFYQFSVISRYTNNLILLLDNDEAGIKGRKTIFSKFGKFANIKNMYVPEPYKDIDEYLSNCEESPSFIVKS
jgi:DNA primase